MFHKVCYLMNLLSLLCAMIAFNGCGTLGIFRKDEPVNYRHVGQTIDVMHETAAKENFKKLAILDFTDIDGRPSSYSKSFNKQLHKKIARLRDQSVDIVPANEFKAVLNRLDIKDVGFLQSAEIARIRERMPALDGIVTGAVSVKEGPVILFFRANGEIVNWQQGLSNMVERIVDQVKTRAIQPLAISTFCAIADGKPNGLGKYMTERIRTELGKLNIKTTSIEDIPKIAEHWALQQTGITDQNTAVEIGKIANAKNVLIGSVAGNLSSSWEVNVKLVDVESGVTIWADNYIELNKGVIQVFLPFELSQSDTSLLDGRERLLLHQVISDENLRHSAKNYYVTSIVSLARIRRSVEIDADMQYAARIAARLTRFRAELENELAHEIAKMRDEEVARLASERKSVLDDLAKQRTAQEKELAELRRLEVERLRVEREAALKRLLTLRNLTNKDYGTELTDILEQLRKILVELEKYSTEEKLSAR